MHVMEIKATVPRVKSVTVAFNGSTRRRRQASIAVALVLFGPLLLTGGGKLLVLNLVGLDFRDSSCSAR